jgi:hypothetical protein
VFSGTAKDPARVDRVAGYEFVDLADAILTLADGRQVYVRLIASGIELGGLTPRQTRLAEVAINISDSALRARRTPSRCADTCPDGQ